MGLDSVEIVMEVENAFGIRIPDREAEKILTVGDFHNLVWKYVKDRETTECKSQSLFYKLRQSISNTIKVPKQAFNPKTDLSHIIPITNRRKLWLQLSSTNGLKFPELVLTKTYSLVLTIVGATTIIGGLAASLILINFFDITKWTLLIPLAGFIFTSLVSKLLDPKRIFFKENNFREFINKVLTLNYKTLRVADGVNRKEVETIISNIIAEKSGLELDEVTPEKNIHNDLGID